MLYFNLIDILFLVVGVYVGIAIMACVSASSYEHKCDNCLFREIAEMVGDENE